MARYRLPARTFFENHIEEAGAIVEYNGKFPGSNWELVDGAPPASPASSDESAPPDSPDSPEPPAKKGKRPARDDAFE